MRVVVLGASGLLGRSVGEELLDRGHEVIAVSRSGDVGARLAARGAVVRADLVTADDAELDRLLTGADAAVHCLGPDDRSPLVAPVDATLERLLVRTTERVAQAVRRQGLRHLVILGSYFCTFDRLYPQWRLGRRHPYIRARIAQARRAEAAGGTGVVSVLEIPFVFGAIDGITPMWKDVFFDRLRRGPIGVTLSGASAAVQHTDVARAVAAIVDGAVPPGRYPLAVDNVSYRRLTRVVLDELGRTVPVVTVPSPVLTAGVVAGSVVYRLRGQGMGLDPWHVARDILARDLSLDPAGCADLGLVPQNLDDEIRRTVRAAYPVTG